MKPKLYNIITLLIIAIASCAPLEFKPGHTELQNFTAKEEANILETLKYLKVYGVQRFAFRKAILPEGILGTAYNLSFYCYVELSPEIFNEWYFKPVLYHEVGHCMGLSHSPNPKDIMYREVRFFNEYTPLDFNRFFKQLDACF